MPKHRKESIRTPAFAIAAATAVVAAVGLSVGEQITHSDQAKHTIPEDCTVGGPKLPTADYRLPTAEKLLHVDAYHSQNIKLFTVECPSLQEPKLEQGVDIGSRTFATSSAQRGVMFEDCVVYESATQPAETDSTQLVMACKGLHNVLFA